MKVLTAFLIAFLFAVSLCAQPKSVILEKYISEGLQNNLSLHTQQVDIQKATLALEQAQALFMPTVNFVTQYTLAAGGRRTDLPVGDLLNPVYNTLNQLTHSASFPTIDNQQINFLPTNFDDIKLHTVYPILNSDLKYNREIRKELINGKQIEINVYRRELVKQIKTAYIQYCQANQAVEIYRNALALTKENQRVNEKLVANNVATKIVVVRSQHEVSKVETALFETQTSMKNAAAYFNFLLNKVLDNPIEIDPAILDGVQNQANLIASVGDGFVQKREEIAQLQSGIKTTDLQLKMNESYKTPKIGASLDVGFQGYGFQIWNKQAYALLGVQLELPVYNANSNKMKARQTKFDLDKLQHQLSEAESQLKLQAETIKNTLTDAVHSLQSNEAELASAREYYRLTDKRYKEGQALLIELIDARTQMTNAELKENLTQYSILLKQVELERVLASYQL